MIIGSCKRDMISHELESAILDDCDSAPLYLLHKVWMPFWERLLSFRGGKIGRF